MFSLKSEKEFLHKYDLWGQGADTRLNDPKTEIKDLISIIEYADWKYYVLDNPILTDKEYDVLFTRLKKLENTHPELVSTTSPTQRVAHGLNTNFSTVQHLVPMLSLDNSYNEEDLLDWHQRNCKLAQTEHIEYCIEPKFDGASISLIYENGKLVRGATRGNGIEGDDITTNIKQIRSIPLHIPDMAEHIEIRGEVVMSKSAFKDYNNKLAKEGQNLLANPRNAASGSLRIKDPKEVANRKLSAYLYHISDYAGNRPYTSHYESLQFLQQAGFLSSLELSRTFTDIHLLIDYCHQFENQRDLLPYEIDGLVLKVNSLHQQEIIGMTSHHPRWAMAFKFKARQARSKLNAIEFQIGRTGSITPVAKIKPTEVGGVTVSSISLFNEEIIQEKNLMLGDEILIERAGDVIPYIVKSFPELRNGTETAIRFPNTCPVCETSLIKPEEEAVWRCPNDECPAQIVERMIHFASKDAMDIRGLGDALIRRFYELGYLKKISDIYQLPYEEISQLEGLGQKSIENLRTSIEKSKQQALHKLLFGLGIRYVGETTAKTLARNIHSIHDIKNLSVEKLMEMEDVGKKVAASIYDYFQNTQNLSLIETLRSFGLNTVNVQKEKKAESDLSGKTFLFTGTLHQLKRKEAEERVENLGGKILSGVSIKLNYLVAGEKAGSKLEKAKKLESITILTEEEFLEMVPSENE